MFRTGDVVYDVVLCIRGRVTGGTGRIGAPYLTALHVTYQFTTGSLRVAYGSFNGEGQNPISQLRHIEAPGGEG